MSTMILTKKPPAVTSWEKNLSPLNVPFFNLDAVGDQFLQETGRTVEQCQSVVLDALRSKEFTSVDALFEPASPDEILWDHAITKQIERIEERVQEVSRNLVSPLETRSPYGTAADDFLRSQQLRLRLHNLAAVVGQEPLRSITVVHSFIPADLLEGPGLLGFSPEQMVQEFLYDFWRAFAETGFSFVRLSGWLELALIENAGQDKADCLADQWLYRGREFFQVRHAPPRSWSLHLHSYGLARRAGEWASAKEITQALEPYFPYRNARLSREFDLKNNADENIGRIGRYRSKLMGDVDQGREMPTADEIAVNVRFWSRCSTQNRDFTICEDWPEIGPRLPKPLDDPDLMKRVFYAWSEAENAWGANSQPTQTQSTSMSKP